jgi:4-hydroxy-tetrahydrodipicolinate synthase
MAIKLDEELKELNEILFVESNPIPVKWILNRLGKIPNGLRLPLVELDSTFHRRAELILEKLSLLN